MGQDGWHQMHTYVFCMVPLDKPLSVRRRTKAHDNPTGKTISYSGPHFNKVPGEINKSSYSKPKVRHPMD